MTHRPAHDDLAALRDGDRSDTPLRLTLEAGVSIEAPSPRRLAHVLVLPTLRGTYDVYRGGGSVLLRRHGDAAAPKPVALTTLADAIRGEVLALPDRADAGRPYQDVRLFLAHGSPESTAAYLDAAARSVRAAADQWRPPRAARGPAMTAAERRDRARARRVAREHASSRWWLECFLAEATPSATAPAAELYAAAFEALAELEDADEVAGDAAGTPIAYPRRRVFLAAADDVLGPRRRVGTDRTAVYTIPDRKDLPA